MSRRHDDFDEFSDPENPRIIEYDDVLEAAERIKPYIVHTPCTPSHHQKEFVMQLYYKLESMQRTGSFKERGALNSLLELPLDKKKLGVVISSIGNHAQSLCYHASRLNIPVMVVMPTLVSIVKMQRCHALGAKVLIQGNNIVEAQRYARALAKDKGLAYINGRDHPHMLAGHGTVALEILEQVPFVDAIIAPAGSGGLLAAVAAVVKRLKPTCLVYGAQPEVMPALARSLESGERETVPIANTIADSIAIPGVGVNAFYTLKPLLDKMLLIKEDWIARSILHMMEEEKLVVEGAGACPLAAILGSLVPELKTKTVVCIVSGGNIDTVLLGRCMDRGRAAEGRLVKFKVGIKDTSAAFGQLLKMLAEGGYCLVRQFRDAVWVEDDVYHVEISNGDSVEYTMKGYYYGNLSDEETQEPKPLKVRAQKRLHNIDAFFDMPKKKQCAGYSSSVAQLTNGGTNYISSSVGDNSKAKYLIKIDVYNMDKLCDVPTDQQWKFADTRVKLYMQSEDEEYYSNTKELIYKITKHIAGKKDCKKYFIDAKK